MADVRVDSSGFSTLYSAARRLGPVWTDDNTGYLIYIDGSSDIVYRKTITGGASWGSRVVIDATSAWAVDLWFDKWTPGDSGTLIHIWWVESLTDDVHYRTLDTATDSLGVDRTVFNGSSFSTIPGRNYQAVTGTKAVGGNLYVQFWGDGDGEHGFYRSADGITWVSRTDGADGNEADEVLLFPDADSADNQDVAMVYWDRSADEISLKKYDNSGNSWSETSISGSMIDVTGSMQMSGLVRHSDGKLLLFAWNRIDYSESDLMVFEIDLATPTITPKTNVVTDSDDCVCVAAFIDQNNDHLYCSYLGQDDGAQTYGSSLQAHYKKSTDGAASWTAETTYQADSADDERYISAGHSTPGAAAGRFQPMFFNDDLNDLFVNKDNSVAISAAAVHEGQATLTGVGGLAVSSAVSFAGAAALLGEGFLSAQATLGTVKTAAATLGGVGSLSAKAVLEFEAKATITGVGLLSGKGARDRAAAATLLGEGLLSARGEVGTEGHATLVGVGSLSADASIDRLGKATLGGVGSLSAAAVVTYAGKASLLGRGLLRAIGETGEILYTIFGRVRREVDPDAYAPGTLWYFEVTLWAPAGGTARARLFNLTTAQEVADSPLNTSSPTEVRLRSPALTLPSGLNIYRAEYGGAIGNAYTIASADLVRVSP